MTATTDLHPLAQGYLDRLRAEASALPDDEATDLVGAIEDHLREAIADQSDETTVRDVLDRLGTPRELVAAAAETSPHRHPASALAATPAHAPGRGVGAVEVLALAGLVGAELMIILWPLAVLLWIAGVVLLAVSRAWSGRQKAWGLASLATGLPLLATALVVPVQGVTTTCTSEAVSTDAVAGSSGPAACVSTGGWPDWAFTVVQVLLVAYLCTQAWTLWRLTRRQ